MRARRDELSSHQSSAVVGNLAEMGANYVPLVAGWCAQLLPEIAEEEEVKLVVLRKLRFLWRLVLLPFVVGVIGAGAGVALLVLL